MKTKLERLLNSFENDTDSISGDVGWMYYGDVDPKEAAQDLARITAENIALHERVEAQNKFIESMEWDETTGECLMGCGGCASDGHLTDCQYIGKLVEFRLMTIES